MRVRVHLYERAFPAKPVRRCDGWSDPHGQLTSTGRRTRQCHRHGAVSPDDRDMHVGRERLPAGQAWGEEGGSKMGVAHAPAVALLGCDRGADRRPAAQSAPASELRCRTSPSTWAFRILHLTVNAVSLKIEACLRPGERCSRTSVPPLCSPLACADELNQSGRTEARDTRTNARGSTNATGSARNLRRT